MATKFDKFIKEEFDYHGIQGECGMGDMMGGDEHGDEVINISDLGDDHESDNGKIKIELDEDSAKYLLHVLLSAMENGGDDDGEDNVDMDDNDNDNDGGDETVFDMGNNEEE